MEESASGKTHGLGGSSGTSISSRFERKPPAPDLVSKIRPVGARGVVHRPQFNGKQEGAAEKSPPNLRCPRNGKWTNRYRFRFHHGH
jgi:hypothetical protein